MNIQLSISSLLKQELENRLRKNSSYSLRAFARDLGVSAPRLSRILNQNLGISPKAAAEIAKKIDLKGNEKDLFLATASSESERSPKKKKAAYDELKSLYKQKYSLLSVDTFQVISEWYHFAIVSLIETKIFKNDPQWIAQELGIKKVQAEQALERLKRLSIVVIKDNKLCVSQTYCIESQHTSHEAIRNFHSQIIGKAVSAIHEQSVDERFVFSSTLAVNKSKLEEIRTLIKNTHQEAETIVGSHEEKDSVYALSVQFFRLNKNISTMEAL